MRTLAWLLLPAAVLCLASKFRGVQVDADRGGLLVDSFGVYVGSIFTATICSSNAATGVPGQLSILPQARLLDYTADITRARHLSLQLCAAPAISSAELSGNASCIRARHVFTAPEQISVLAMLCGSGSLTLEGELTVINPSLGSHFAHLSIDAAGLPGLCDALLALYAAATLTWLTLCATQRSHVTGMHAAFGVVAALRCGEAAADCVAVRALGATGLRASQHATVAGVLQTLSTGAFLAVLLSMGFGWSVTRSHLRRREYAGVAALLLAYTVIGIMNAKCSDSNCNAFAMLEYVVRAMEMLATIVALNYQVATLRLSLEDDVAGPSTATTYALIAAFERLRWAFAAYVLLPPLLVILRISVLDWTHEWVLTAMHEALHAWVYISIGVAFYPRTTADHDIVAAALKEWHARHADAAHIQLRVTPQASAAQHPLWRTIVNGVTRAWPRPASSGAIVSVPSSASSATSSEPSSTPDDASETRALAGTTSSAARERDGNGLMAAFQSQEAVAMEELVPSGESASGAGRDRASVSHPKPPR